MSQQIYKGPEKETSLRVFCVTLPWFHPGICWTKKQLQNLSELVTDAMIGLKNTERTTINKQGLLLEISLKTSNKMEIIFCLLRKIVCSQAI